MANYTAADVKRLRELTGSGMLDCKNALANNDGDFDKAVEELRIKGAKDVGKRAERSTAEGLVAAKGGALIELNSETDFVAKNEEFQQLADAIDDAQRDGAGQHTQMRDGLGGRVDSQPASQRTSRQRRRVQGRVDSPFGRGGEHATGAQPRQHGGSEQRHDDHDH